MMRKIRFFIPLFIAITLLSVLVYGVGQQTYRQLANDPQLQMAEDIASSFSNGALPILPNQVIDVGASLSPFVILYDGNKKAVASSGQLQGKTPVIPQGVLDYTKQNGQEILTWQPMSGVRLATVVRHYSNGKDSGYVLVARSLRVVEARKDLLGVSVLFGWAVTVVATFIGVLIFAPSDRKKK